jgi:2-oxoisovalerate dehydrogenase E1 component
MAIARTKRKAVFLHMRCVRLMGHAGSDIESQYLSMKAIENQEARDPLLVTAAYLRHFGVMTQQEILTYYQNTKSILEAKAQQLLSQPRLSSKAAVMKSLTAFDAPLAAKPVPNEAARQQTLGAKYSSLTLKRTLQQCINLALTDLMLQYPNILVFGEDVGKKGGVYRVSADLQTQFGQRRVFDTLLDETTILGSAIGFAHNGFLPIPEIQFLAYFHNAEDQLRGEAATLSFFSNGQYQNPMVIRIAGLGYQKGFGGHFHNDNSIAVLRDIPGLIIAAPSNGRDAVLMLRECVRLAHQERRIVVFLEPIALYMTKDLHQDKDDAWLCQYPPLTQSMALGSIEVVGQGETLIISYANGYYLSRQAAKVLATTHDRAVKVLDIRWLAPLPLEAISHEVKKAKRVLIVDEGRKTGSISEAIMTGLMETLSTLPKIARLTGEDTFIPLGDAWQYVLPSLDAIITKIIEMES